MSKIKYLLYKPDKLIVAFLLFLLICSITGLLTLKKFGKLGTDSFGREVGKTLLQIISVSVIGTTATLLLAVYNNHRSELQKEIERSHQQAEKEKELKRLSSEREKELQRISDNNKNEFKKDILRRLTNTYADVKRARRMLRAKAFTTPYYREWNEDALVLLEFYDQYLGEINESQLKLEIISREIKVSKNIFQQHKEILIYIKSIEECLKDVVTEYEISRSKFKGEPPVLPIRNLDYLKDMLGSEEKRFAKEFFKNASELFSCLRREVLEFR